LVDYQEGIFVQGTEEVVFGDDDFRAFVIWGFDCSSSFAVEHSDGYPHHFGA
jgi:hypothetical protein